MKRLVVGLTAHVDSGKTTLAEALLLRAGDIRKQGRVDHGDAFLDTDPLERRRGITIFSKQAVMHLPEGEYTLLDTPGHVDFSAEAERALSVIDCAVLVISGTDGVQSHTETLWRLLRRYSVPTFIFVNKMDISPFQRGELIEALRRRLGGGCIDFSQPWEQIAEQTAECDERCMNAFLESGDVPREAVRAAISACRVFPAAFGSALKLKGIDELLGLLGEFADEPPRPQEFGARVYKITPDENGARLTHMKICGGALRVRSAPDSSAPDEKAGQIRVYSGAKFTTVEEAPAGTLCAVTGLTRTYAGQGIGAQEQSAPPLLEPVMAYRLILPQDADVNDALSKLRRLEEEDPMLRITWSEQLREIHVSIMGEIQLEILRSLIQKRFGLDVGFDEGSIAYKETIAAPVLGMGHYEPLRHYAEVHLLLEPAERGSGLHFRCDCRKDDLDINWQRLILTHLAEKQHLGVLTGSPITDMTITVVAGRAHVKHTEGGDFRQATYRAVRQGLASAQSVLLEPFYSFELELPLECVGRAMTDLQRMGAEFNPPRNGSESAVISGTVPVSELRGYQAVQAAYTKGRGRLSCVPAGYFPCHNAEEVIARTGYRFEADTDNPADSVFCSHGAGVLVKWNEAPARMHADSGIRFGTERAERSPADVPPPPKREATDKELMEIFERTYGKIQRREYTAMRPEHRAEPKPRKLPLPPKGPEYLLVDGYNIIFAWEELSQLAKHSLDAARARLTDILCNYQGFRRCRVILVFDAYRVKGAHREVEQTGGISVVYTKEAETADMYIEKAVHELARDSRVRVATSDGLEQVIILGGGAMRVSAAEFLAEVEDVERQIRKLIDKLKIGD